MVCCPHNQLDSWAVHLDGAAALLEQASFSEALKNGNARPQLQYLYFRVFRYFSVQGNIPSDLLNWSPHNVSSAKPNEQPAVDLVDILIRFAKLHHTLHHDQGQDSRAAARSALSFDTELEEWEKNLPEQWAFILEESNNYQHTFNGKYLFCKEVWASRILNHYFWGRLVANEMILSHLGKLHSPSLSNLQQQRRALDTISCMATNICAGAASQMGAFGHGAPADSTQKLPPLNGVFMLLFPLAVAGGAAGAPDDVHEWVVQTLQEIGGKMGIQRALELIPKLKDSRQRKMGGYWQDKQQGM